MGVLVARGASGVSLNGRACGNRAPGDVSALRPRTIHGYQDEFLPRSWGSLPRKSWVVQCCRWDIKETWQAALVLPQSTSRSGDNLSPIVPVGKEFPPKGQRWSLPRGPRLQSLKGS